MRQRWHCWLLQLLPGVIPHNTVIQYNAIQHNISVNLYNVIPPNVGVIQYNTVVILHNVILHNISVIQYNTVTPLVSNTQWAGHKHLPSTSTVIITKHTHMYIKYRQCICSIHMCLCMFVCMCVWCTHMCLCVLKLQVGV